MVKKIVASLILCMVILSSLFACSDSAPNISEDSVDTRAAESVETTTSTVRNAIADLPDLNFNGAKFVFYIGAADEYQVYSETLNGELLNDIVYERNRTVSEKYNVNIITKLINSSDRYKANEELVRNFIDEVFADDNTFNVAATFAYQSGGIIAQGVCEDWHTMPYIDFTDPWWNALATEAATINGKMFTAVSDLSVTAMLYTNCFFFNTEVANNYDITQDDLYNTVFDGKWTIDNFVKLTADIYQDLDSDNTPSVADLYGFSSSLVDSVFPWPLVFNNPITTVDSNGTLQATFMTDKIQTGYEKLYNLLFNQLGTYIPANNGDEVAMFASNKVVFIPGFFDIMFNKLRDMNSEYSILPYPKYDEAQENYYTSPMDEYSVFMIPKTIRDKEIVAVVMEALSVGSYNTVSPAYYDQALKGKYASSEDMAKIVDLIMENRVFDIAFMFGSSIKNLPYLFRPLLNDKSLAIASEYEKISTQVDAGLTKIMGYYK